MKKAMPALCLAALIICVLSGCRVDDISSFFSRAGQYADTVNHVTEDFTPEQEYYLGRAVAARIIEQYPALKDDKANAYLNQIGQALALCSKQPYTYGGYHFLLLDAGEVNAFAAPDGFIFVTKGMLRLVSGESELAAVLAHEIAHVQSKDAVKAIQSSRMTEALVQLGKDSAGKYVSDLPGARLIQLFSGSVDDIVTSLVTKGYSRSQEYTADTAAKEILTRTGYDSQFLGAVLRAMEKQIPSGSSGFGSTHPSAADRLSSLKLPNTPVGQEPEARARRFKAALSTYFAVAP
ncbi:MAG: M48 family metalloprotease [Desulfovibrio sp.]|jgi:predicted Zn-dependent protease|nr:M48 family metalloprotease [Desulfovibrio sp.]